MYVHSSQQPKKPQLSYKASSLLNASCSDWYMTSAEVPNDRAWENHQKIHAPKISRKEIEDRRWEVERARRGEGGRLEPVMSWSRAVRATRPQLTQQHSLCTTTPHVAFARTSRRNNHITVHICPEGSAPIVAFPLWASRWKILYSVCPSADKTEGRATPRTPSEHRLPCTNQCADIGLGEMRISEPRCCEGHASWPGSPSHRTHCT